MTDATTTPVELDYSPEAVLARAKAAKIAQLRAKAAELRAYADRLTAQANRAADNAPGSFITGRSGRTRAMNRRTERALDLTVTNAGKAVDARRKAEKLEREALDIENDGDARRAAAKAARKQAEKKVRTAEVALPLVNDQAASLHITSAEWAKTPSDYREVSARAGYRERTMIRCGTLQTVYLTDKPIKAKPEKVAG